MEPLFVTKYWNDTCFLCNTKTTKNHKLWPKQKLLRFLFSLQGVLFETFTIIITLVLEISYSSYFNSLYKQRLGLFFTEK